MTEQAQEQESEGLTEEQLLKIADAMKDNAPTPEEKQNVHAFLNNVMLTEDNTKVGNLRDDKEYNELGFPVWNVRGALEMAQISELIIGNNFFKEYFEKSADNTLKTSLSRNGFLIKAAVTQVKSVSDSTKRRRTTKGFFKKNEEETGGDALNT